jgi:U4/U6.U5 tri-snRNP component SNU23
MRICETEVRLMQTAWLAGDSSPPCLLLSVCGCVFSQQPGPLTHPSNLLRPTQIDTHVRTGTCATLLCTCWQVKARLDAVKAQQAARRPDDFLPEGIDRRLAEREAEEERARAERRERKKEAKRIKAAGEDEDEGGGGDDEMMALMGFGGFGGSKKG